MAINELVEKIAQLNSKSEVKLTDDELSLLKSAVTKDDLDAALKKAGESEAKAARILDEKKKAQAKLEEYQKEIESIKGAGLSDLEKLEKALEKANSARELAIKDAEDSKNKLLKTVRENQIDKITNSVRFMDAIPWDMRIQAIAMALQEVEDLGNEAAVKDIMNKFKESHKGVLASETAPKGSGGRNNNAPQIVYKDPSDMSDEERAKHLRSIKK